MWGRKVASSSAGIVSLMQPAALRFTTLPVRSICRGLACSHVDCLRWVGRGRAWRVGAVFGAGRTGAAGDGAASRFRDRGRARESRGADAALDLRVFGPLSNAISFRMTHPSEGRSR
jgi:hypothetical protein